jgi:hypothetical protein
MEDLITKWLYSYSHYHYLREAIPKRAFYAYRPSGPNLVHKVRRYNRLYAEYRLTPPATAPGGRISDDEAKKQIGSLKTVRQEFTDLDVDVLDILMGIWLDRRREIDKYVEVDTDQILHARGLKHKVNGQGSNRSAIGRGYTPQQREAVNRSICRLLLLWGEVQVIHSHDKEDFNGEGRVLEVDDRGPGWRELASQLFEFNSERNNTNEDKRQSFSYRPGEIFRHFNLRQRMYQPAKIYNYNYDRYWREKRLGRYLMWQWRVNRQHERSTLVKSTTSLLNSLVLNLDRNRFKKHEDEDVFDMKEKYRPEGNGLTYRVRKRLERTLDRLRTDEIIGDWDYLDGWKPSWSRKSNWADLWSTSEILLSPSESLVNTYQGGDDSPQDSDESDRSPQEKSLPTLLTEVKTRFGLTQEELGDEIGGFDQSYVSALINGRKTPSVSSAKSIRERLNSMVDQS